MVEIECPNCHARYQVPAEALGPGGRDVTCSSCGNIWHATPVQEPAVEASQLGMQTQPPQRREQMSEIRQMLDQVQSGQGQGQPQAEQTRRWGARGELDEPASPRADVHRAVFGHAQDEADEDEIERTESFLRERANLGGQSGRLQTTRRGGKVEDEATSRRKLMKQHSRRTRRYDAEKRRSRGTGMTGFVLVALVAGVLVGLYSLHERIIDRLPGSEPALRNYVAAVDEMRLALQNQIGSLQQQVEETTAGDG